MKASVCWKLAMLRYHGLRVSMWSNAILLAWRCYAPHRSIVWLEKCLNRDLAKLFGWTRENVG